MTSLNIEQTACRLMQEYKDGNLTAIQSTLKDVDPGLIRYTLTRSIEHGKTQFKQKNYEGAITSFTQALAGYTLNSRDEDICDTLKEVKIEKAKIYANRSQCFILQGGEENYMKAFEDAKDAILLYPEWSKAWFRAGKALYLLNIFDKASIVFKAALKREIQNEKYSQDKVKEEIENWIRICEKKADHNAAIQRITVDYSRFEHILKELEDQENIESVNEISGNYSNNKNIITLPAKNLNSTIGSSGSDLQLELSPDLSKEEISNLKQTLTGVVENNTLNNSRKKKMVFNNNMKFLSKGLQKPYENSLRGMSRIVQLSSEIYWYKRIINIYLDTSEIYLSSWIEILTELLNYFFIEESCTVLFIGSGTMILPIYLMMKIINNSINNVNILVTTQMRPFSPCLQRLYANMASSNGVNILQFNTSTESLSNEELNSPDRINNNKEGDENLNIDSINMEISKNLDKNNLKIKVIHGNVQNVNPFIWKQSFPRTIIIDASQFEPGLLGYGLIANLWSLYKEDESINTLSTSSHSKYSKSIVVPSDINVFIHFANIKIPSFDFSLNEKNCRQESFADDTFNSSEICMDRLNEGLWSPYWEPLNPCYPLEYLTEPIPLGLFPIEDMVNNRNLEFFKGNNEVIENMVNVSFCKCICATSNLPYYNGSIEYYLPGKKSINAIILSYKALRNTIDHDKQIIIDTLPQFSNEENEGKYIFPSAVQWLGGVLSNNTYKPVNIKFECRVEHSRILLQPLSEIITLLSNPEHDNTNINIPIIHLHSSSVPRPVLENLCDVESLNMWIKVLIKTFRESSTSNSPSKLFEGIISSSSPAALLPMILLYASSNINKTPKHNLFPNWNKLDVHFTAIENFPNLQELYKKLIKDNLFTLLCDVIKNDVKPLYEREIISKDPSIQKSKYWKSINTLEDNSNTSEQHRISKVNFYRWIQNDTTTKYLLNKKLNERLSFHNGDVRQIILESSNSSINNNNGMYITIKEKARLFTGMNFDHDALSEGIIPLWSTVFQSGVLRNTVLKTSLPVPCKLCIYGIVTQIGNDSTFGVNTSDWDTYRFDGPLQWNALKYVNNTPIYDRSEIFHILTIDLIPGGFNKLKNWVNNIIINITSSGRINSLVVFFDIWLNSENILTTNPFKNHMNSSRYIELQNQDNNQENSSSQIYFKKTNLWKPVYHMMPQFYANVGDNVEFDFSLAQNLTKLKFIIKNITSHGNDTPSTINSDESDNRNSVFPQLGDIGYLQLRDKYDNLIREVGPKIYSNDSPTSLEAFNASIDIAVNPAYFAGKNAISSEDMPFDLESVNWLCQSFLT
ncbi:hypothetical protein cand_016470 [Cryptosporidium andersoni]|uniref:Uncharacterized protein n=1 Tax=Cryptosporidium andersoni TaxID=117008 RepID=A0A1J4MTT4_9CRYT|nr:hypothetical protein cand_016470 [Cryptosporidium andersoni]